jgi:acetate kinase
VGTPRPTLRVASSPSALDESVNATVGAGGPRISRPDSRVAARVIPTNEELMIARHTQRLLAGKRP